MRKPKLRELGEAVRALAAGPYTSGFPAEPIEPPENFRGKPAFQPDGCVGCAACVEVCPAGAIAVTDRAVAPPLRHLEVRLDQCIFCGQCELNCLTQSGIRLTREFDLATLDRSAARESVDKELVLCEQCGIPVATREHLLFLAEEVGSLAYSNPALMLARDEALGLVQYTEPAYGEVAQRADAMKVLCPECRRAVVARDVFGPVD